LGYHHRVEPDLVASADHASCADFDWTYPSLVSEFKEFAKRHDIRVASTTEVRAPSPLPCADPAARVAAPARSL
jgi:hypothetical protein